MKKSIITLSLIALVLTACTKDDDTQPNSPSSSFPVQVIIESIVLTGFSPVDASGDGWDGNSGNLPDPYVELSKQNIPVYVSVSEGGASSTGTYPMNTAHTGSLPVSYNEGEQLRIRLLDRDSADDADSDYIGYVTILDPISFFYPAPGATEFTDVEISGTNDIKLKLTGSFVY